MSRWHEEVTAYNESFSCLMDLFTPDSFALTVVKAVREWGQRILCLFAEVIKERDELEQETIKLRERISELERSAALDSTTSSKPPASDGLKKKNKTPKRTQSLRGKSDKPSGGQPGHKGHTLMQTDTPDHVVDHDPPTCTGCGAALSDANRVGDPVRRQVFDVPEPPPLETTEHRGHNCLCTACGTVTKATFPDGVKAPVQYGPRLTAWVAYLLHAQFVPEGRVAELMSDIFAIKLSTATIAAMSSRTAERFQSFYDGVAEIIRSQTLIKHLDETSLRVDGKKCWLHVLCTPLLTILRVTTNRRLIDEVLTGFVVHDDYAPYFSLKGVWHVACNAHHQRELNALIKIEKEKWAASIHRLLSRALRATHFARNNDRELPPSLVDRFSRAWDRTLKRAIDYHEQLQPPLTGKRGRKKRRVGHNLALRLQTHKEGCLRFITDLRMPFTNNCGNADIRIMPNWNPKSLNTLHFARNYSA